MRVLLTVLTVQISLKHFPSSMHRFSYSTFPLCQEVPVNIGRLSVPLGLCVCVTFCSLLTSMREVQGSQGHHRWVRMDPVLLCVCVSLRGQGGRQCLPLSLWCVTFAAELSPTNGALVEPCKESPAGVLLESAWGRLGTAGSVWSTSADVRRMSTASLPSDDDSQSAQTREVTVLSTI